MTDARRAASHVNETTERTSPYRLAIAGADGTASVRELLEGFVASPGLDALLAAAGVDRESGGTLVGRLAARYAGSEIWDFRRGGERLDIASVDLGVPPEAVQAGARELGMDAALTPTESAYDHVVVLGGTALACHLRLRYVRELVEGGLRARHIACLGALRRVPDLERELLAERTELERPNEVQTEFDALVASATHFFPPAGPINRVHESAEHVHLETASACFSDADGRAIEVVAAPSAEPLVRRANTVDNYRSYASAIADGDSVLIVTSSIYAPYQFFVALRALGWSRPLTVELVGFPPEWLGGVLTAPQNYLQETRSALFGALGLAQALAGEE